MFMSLCHHNTTGICLLSLVTQFVSRIHAQTKALQFVPGFKKKEVFSPMSNNMFLLQFLI